MIRDHRPYWLKHLTGRFERWFTGHFIAPQCAAFGDNHTVMKPWNVKVHGQHITIGNNVHIVTDSHRKVALSTWTFAEHQGHIDIGDHVLICPGCRFDSADRIVIGDNCMFAAGAYVTDADWHDIYDRTRAVGACKPVTLGDNVWIGDGATVCKGVTIGDNSVIGAGSVVASDIPANVIAAGNPAQVIRPLDPNRELVKREQIFRDPAALAEETDRIDRYVLHHNTFFGLASAYLVSKTG